MLIYNNIRLIIAWAKTNKLCKLIHNFATLARWDYFTNLNESRFSSSDRVCPPNFFENKLKKNFFLINVCFLSKHPKETCFFFKIVIFVLYRPYFNIAPLRCADSVVKTSRELLHLVHYFHLMRIFMSYAISRPIWSAKEQIGYISETLSQESVSFVERTIYRYQENVESDKTRRR